MESAQMFEPALLLKDGLLKMLPKFRQIRNLRPSQQAFFHTAVKRYGYALHALQDEIEIHRNGSASLKQVGLFYIVCGERTSFARWYEFEEPIVAKPDGSPDVSYDVKGFIVPSFGEEMDHGLLAALDCILKGASHADASLTDFGLSSGAEFAKTTAKDGSVVVNPKRVLLVIDAPNALP